MKKVELDLVGVDGNAFAVMGAFRKAARRQGWSKEEIDGVLAEARNGDYNHLLYTIQCYCNCPISVCINVIIGIPPGAKLIGSSYIHINRTCTYESSQVGRF